MADSGLVEFASHSYDLHRGVPANPQGSLVPGVIAFRYDAASGTYEHEPAHIARLRADLARNSTLIESKIGRRPRVMVWPFGRDSMQAIEVARELGMPVTMSLVSGANTLKDDLSRVRRDQLVDNPPLRDFISMVSMDPDPLPQRVVHVDLDYVYDADPRQQQANIDQSARSNPRAANHHRVFAGIRRRRRQWQAEAMYFPNRHLPLRADLFSYVAWQLSTRAFVKVYAWMPVLAFELPSTHSAAALTVQSADAASAHPAITGVCLRSAPMRSAWSWRSTKILPATRPSTASCSTTMPCSTISRTQARKRCKRMGSGACRRRSRRSVPIRNCCSAGPN
jgi:biofilm PGA synthesis lipoprotein PgaB